MANNKILIEALLNQRDNHIRGGIYWKTQIDMAYNSNKIEGSRLSRDQTRAIFENTSIEGKALITDIKETDNHFAMFNYMLDYLEAGTDIEIIKAYHRILKTGIPQYDGISGDWKLLGNEVGNTQTVAPKQVDYEMNRLVNIFNDYKADGKKVGLLQVLAFHVQYERIHPFLDGNGRTGRMIMFAQCLQNDIEPFIVLDDYKEEYIQALSTWSTDNTEPLVNLCENLQQSYRDSHLYLLDDDYALDEQSIDRAFENIVNTQSANIADETQ